MHNINVDNHKDERGLRRAAERYTDNTYNTICRHGNKINCSDSYDKTQENPSNYLPRAFILFYLHVLFNSNCYLNVRARSAMSSPAVASVILSLISLFRVNLAVCRVSIFEQLLSFEYFVMVWLLLHVQSCYVKNKTNRLTVRSVLS